MTNKILGIQGDNPSLLNPKTDTTIFLANEIQKRNIRYSIMSQEIYL